MSPASPNPFDAWLKDTLAPVLRGRGFRGGPRSYWRRTGDVYSTIQFQASMASRSGWTPFVINYGIRHDGVARVLGVTRSSPRTFSGSHFGCSARCSPREQWWVFSGEDTSDTVLSSVQRTLADEVIPWLDEFGNADGYRRHVESLPPVVGQQAAMFLRALEQLEVADVAPG